MPHNVGAEPSSSSSSGTAVKKSNRLSTSSLSQTRMRSPTSRAPEGGVKFPRIDECAHFHYETVDCGKVELTLLDGPPDGTRLNGTSEFDTPEQAFWINVKCKGKEWAIRRIADQFKTLDELLHECVYDRRFTHLQRLNKLNTIEDSNALHEMLRRYVARLSQLPEDQMSCAPVLHWFDMDNKGTKLVAVLRETADINIPAVAAAHTIRRYTAQSSEELSLEVGDMVSIIDMSDPNWWRGKCKLQVGTFPAQCVRRISDAKQAEEVPTNVPSSPTSASPPILNTSRTKPIHKKHGKFMEFLRSFLVTRPTKSRLKQTGILKERVFGCDLGEYLHNCGDEVPVVVRDCTEFVEKYGIVDGIYRISGVSSHVQNLRHDYDCERRPDLNRDPSGRGEQSFCDPHSVAGLCKLYFRELPNPLLTYQLYNRFATAINACEDERLLKIHDVIQQLPPPHYRTLKHLAIHLQKMSTQDEKTSMHCRNLAIVWAPNLLRSRDLEAGLAAFTEARVQSVVTEFLVANANILFSDELQNIQLTRGKKPPRPKSLMVLSGPKLISLEEAQARSKAGGGFSKPSSENFANSVKQDERDVVRRSRKMSSPPGYPDGESKLTSPSKAVAITPLSSGSHSVFNKRRQSMDPKLTHSRPQQNFPSNPRHYASQHSGSRWRSKIGSFLKKGSTTPASETAPKPEVKAALRRSLSDDSLLSSHVSRQGGDKMENVKTNSSKARIPTDHAARRQGNSPRSPRPKGRFFLPNDQIEIIDVGETPGEQKSFAEISGTPDSIPTPSLETNPSSHNPFSGLDSDFPAIMGESGLGFNPLQYSPTSSSDSGIPEIPKSSADSIPTSEDTPHPSSNENSFETPPPTNGHHPAEEGSIPPKTIGRLMEIRTIKKEGGNVSTTTHQDLPACDEKESISKELDNLYLNSKIEDILNANVKIKELVLPDNDADDKVCSGIESVGTQNVKRKKFQTVVNTLESYSGNRVNANNNNQGKKFLKQKSEGDASPSKPKPTYYWKNVEVDSLTEIDNLSFEHETKNKPPGNQKQAKAVNVPETGSYSIQYACSQHQSNGRMRQSITATFVQDRPLDSRMRRPHSIKRSMDVPPTDVGHPSDRSQRGGWRMHHRSANDIAKRHKAYAALISHRNKEPMPDHVRRLHHRSLSAGNELDLDLESQPVPAPRSNSIKPVPMPRQRILARFEKLNHNKNDVDSKGSHYHSRATSAPSTPVDGTHPRTIFSHAHDGVSETLSEAVTLGTAFVENAPSDNSEVNLTQSTEHKSPVSTHKSLSKANSASGIVSPSDSVCASTVLSWV